MSKLAALVATLSLSLAVLAGAGVAASTTAKPHGSPVRFISHVVRLLVANRYADAWPSLNPADQALAPEPVYVACESQSPIPGRLVSLLVLHVGRDRIGVAVRFRLRIAVGALATSVPLTAHAVVSGQRWAWVPPPARQALYRAGCGLGEPPTP